MKDEKFSSLKFHYLGCLRSTPIFSNLSDSEISFFQDSAQIRLFKKGKIVFLEGEPSDYFYIVSCGWVKLFHTLPEGDELILDVMTTGQVVGESALFDNSLHMCSAQVVEDCQLLSIPARILRERICTNRTLAFNILASMSRYHRQHFGEIALNTMQSAPQRIGRFLLRFCPHNKKQNIIFHLPYDKTLIADTLGMKGATFSRALNILRQKTGVRIKGARVEIDSLQTLTNYVHGISLASPLPARLHTFDQDQNR